MNALYCFVWLTGDSSNDADVSSVMGFAGFGECFSSDVTEAGVCVLCQSHMITCNISLTLRKESSNLWPGGHVWADEADGHREKSASFRSVRLFTAVQLLFCLKDAILTSIFFTITEERQKQEVQESSGFCPVSVKQTPSTSTSR